MTIPVRQIIDDVKRDALFTQRYNQMLKDGYDSEYVMMLHREGWNCSIEWNDHIKRFLFALVELERVGFEVISWTKNLKVRFKHNFQIEQHKLLEIVNSVCKVATIRFSKGAIWIEFPQSSPYVKLPEELPDFLKDLE